MNSDTDLCKRVLLSFAKESIIIILLFIKSETCSNSSEMQKKTKKELYLLILVLPDSVLHVRIVTHSNNNYPYGIFSLGLNTISYQCVMCYVNYSGKKKACGIY